MSNRLIETLLADGGHDDTVTIHLLSGLFITCAGERLPVPEGSKRLLALVALNSGQDIDRRWAAGTLWPCGGDTRAAGNLRSALWRLKCAGIELLDSDKTTLSLRPNTVVDVELVYRWAEQVLDPAAHDLVLCGLGWRTHSFDLLPGWYDDWVLLERERLRQLFLHALDALSHRLLCDGRFAEAVETALVSVRAEPLRESAQRALVRAHLAEGNLGEARRVHARYCSLLQEELDVLPDPSFLGLLDDVPIGARDDPDGRRRVPWPSHSLLPAAHSLLRASRS